MSEPSANGHDTAESAPAYGLMAEFETANALVKAARAAREQGYRKLDAYTPFPIEELTDALHLHRNRLPLLVLLGGLTGGSFGYLLQYYVTVLQYPINVAGRPLHSWPEYFVITFECTILFAGLTTVLGLLGLCGLPMPYHPVFNNERFGMASRDRFFLCIESEDPLFDRRKTAQFLESLDAKEVSEVAQ
ncbi:MAG: DUF3341 domain-containing protein [Bryobacteraceae bacterium]